MPSTKPKTVVNTDRYLVACVRYLAVMLMCGAVSAQTLPTVVGSGASGDAAITAITEANRPRIGLVLGGGGAKGAAHIGVLRILEELRIPIDCVAGTSMGALIGATFASGVTVDEIEAAVRGIDWAETLADRDLRNRTPIENKLTNPSYSNTLDLGLSEGRLRGRGGLISTQNVEGLLTRLVAGTQFVHDFDELPIPFRAVATDMLAGEMMVLSEGELAVAMRASMAIPGVFAPVEIDDKLLADGGMMRNLPVDVARDLCADVVIAVWMSSPQPDAASTRSTLGMIGRALEVMVGTNEKAQIAALTVDDVGIDVPLGDIGTADFQRAGEAIDLGRDAAAAYREQLARLSVTEEQYRTWSASVQDRGNRLFSLDNVEIVGLDRVNADYVALHLENTTPGATVSVSDLVTDTERLYALGDFERVEYRLTGSEQSPTVEIRPIEKSWGPDFLGIDYGITTSDDADLFAILRVDHERTWINSRGGRWHNELQIGRQSRLATGFYQPLDVRQNFFVHPTLRLENNLEDVYQDGDRLASYDIGEYFGQVDFGANLGTRAQLRLGLRHGFQSAKLDTGIPGLPELPREKDSSLQTRVIYDTRDVVSLPKRGTYFSARHAYSVDWFGSELDYSVIEGVLSQAFNVNGNSLSVMMGADILSGDTPVSQVLEVGGIRTFPGLRPGELRGSQYWFAGTSYLWRVADLQPIFGQSLYAGFRLQAGRMRDEQNDSDTGTLFGLSGSLSGRTPVGPFELSLGWVKDNDLRLQFLLGRPVAEGSLLDEL